MVWTDRSQRFFANPWGELQHEADKLFRELFSGTDLPSTPPANVYVGDDEVLFRVEVPGYGKEDLELEFEQEVLSVRGFERTECEASESEAPEYEASESDSEECENEVSGKRKVVFHRAFRMPYRVNSEALVAKLEHGLLEVRVPRAESDKARRIEISS